ncbi:MAG: PEP/pyruvate-binding domain-containing protein [Pseudomonadota bacterium]
MTDRVRLRAARLPALAAALLLASLANAAEPPATEDPRLADFGRWIEDMKLADRGPFERIRWFCEDGSVLPPRPYACREHGGGRQHGQWSERTREIRDAGILIANFLVEIEPRDARYRDRLGSVLESVLIEQFLIAVDDGWILRRARFYRGAFQAEQEERAAQTMLLTLMGEGERRFAVLLDAARVLPRAGRDGAVGEIRQLATQINKRDEGFRPLRNKIHGRLGADDAERVRAYAARQPASAQTGADLERLATLIDQATNGARGIERLASLANAGGNPTLSAQLRAASGALTAPSPAGRLDALATYLQNLRSRWPSLEPADRLRSLDAMLVLENHLGNALRAFLEDPTHSRRERLGAIASLSRALQALGLLSRTEVDAAAQALGSLSNRIVPLEAYRNALQTLELIPTWAGQRLALYYGPTVARFAAVEPLAREFVPDRLRASPVLQYSVLLEALARDAQLAGGVEHRVFDRIAASGLRSLNPGVARGVLKSAEALEDTEEDTRGWIVTVPETLAELPPVAGILTEREGNQLSHVQLLARNLGIPNIVVGDAWLSALEARREQPIVLAGSPRGTVLIDDLDDTYAELFPAENADAPSAGIRIVVDVDRLDLQTAEPLPVEGLDGGDSGVRVGPKAAQLGRLSERFQGRVSPALALPFGSFRRLLDRPFGDSDLSAFGWLRARYAELGAYPVGPERLRYRNRFLGQMREWLQEVELDPAFVETLREAMASQFGADGTYGVFVRSDTNVEDLPGFTGAGLNLTVPNVVGFDAILAAIRRVWASPFSERAFGWRQALMDKPEHVYAAVLLHQSVNADVSGVLVTTDIERDRRGALTVVLNEGVGGGVEGQRAETAIVSDDGTLRWRASATDPRRRVLLPGGGSRIVAAMAPERLLTPARIEALKAFAGALDDWFDQPGTIADVEFGFLGDQLVLFQIRPFLENDAAQANEFLSQLDAPYLNTADRPIDLDQRPLSTQGQGATR